MPCSVTCPHCGAQSNVADECPDRPASCGSCGKRITTTPSSAARCRSRKPLVIRLSRAINAAVLVFLAIIVVLYLLLMFGFISVVHTGPESAGGQCNNHLRYIAQALLNYESARGRFPAAGASDKDGEPVPSWRVAILPFIEMVDLYSEYHRKEPWNSSKNQAIAASMPDIYRCPSDPKGGPTSQETSYVVIAGEGGVGGLDDEARNMKYISAHSGASNTILVIEVPGSGVHWMDPRDLTIDEIIERIKRRDRGGHAGGFNVAFCDGHTQFIRDDIAPETLRALADPNRTEPVDESKF